MKNIPRTLEQELRDDKAISQCAQEFNMVGDPTRLKICYLLCHHTELSVSEIASFVGVSVSAVSRTLKKLKEAEVVTQRRDFRTVYYKLKPTSFTNFLTTRLRATL